MDYETSRSFKVRFKTKLGFCIKIFLFERDADVLFKIDVDGKKVVSKKFVVYLAAFSNVRLFICWPISG